MKIAFFGSSLVSAYWNGPATYYRGIVRALAERDHEVTFFEPDAYGQQVHRDIPDPPWAQVVVYPATTADALRMVERARGADVVVKASGVGVNDELLDAAVLSLQGPRTRVAFWDIDAPATLDRIGKDPQDPFRELVPRYDVILTYRGGPPVVSAYERLGARRCVPIYNALDPAAYHPVPPDPRFAASLGLLSNRFPDREERVDAYFLRAAAALPDHHFLLGGSGWADKPMPDNVGYVGHVYTRDRNAFNVTPLAVLDISRASAGSHGFSPTTRMFEAAGVAACLITDAWEGLENFLEPDREMLVASTADDVARHVASLTRERARRIGDAAYGRMLSEHTYAHRALDVEAALGESVLRKRVSAARRAPTLSEEADPLSIVVLGLSITSSWGNCHAATYRGLVRELAARGHQVTFLERDGSWYGKHRDLPQPPYARTILYKNLGELRDRFTTKIRDADLVIVGSYVPDGIAVGRWVIDNAKGVTAFYDIDTPVTLSQLDAGTCEYLAPNLIPLYRLYLSFTGGPELQRIEQTLGSPCARALYCSVDPELFAPQPQPRHWDLGYIGTYTEDRQPAVHRLLLEPARREADRRFVVAGPLYPPTIEWSANVERIEHLAPDAHRAFYNRCCFSLYVSRWAAQDSGWSPSVRLFAAAACGIPIISSPWHGLDELFDVNHEVLVAHTTEDVLRYLHDLDEDARAEIGERGRARVLAEHTASHRAAELEAHVREVR